MTRYMVVWIGDKQGGHQVMRGEYKDFNYDSIRLFLTRIFPGRTIASPLEDLPKGGTVVTVYVSPNRNGVGRIEYNHQQWAIGPKPPENSQ